MTALATNLVVHPSAKVGAVTGWVPRGQASANFAVVSPAGVPASPAGNKFYNLQRTVDGGGANSIYMGQATSDFIAVTPGQIVSAGFNALAATNPQALQVRLLWWLSDKTTNISNIAGGSGAPDSTSVWTQAALNGVTVPATATWMQVRCEINANVPEGEVHYIDAICAVLGSSLPTYFDGDYLNALWTSTPNASTSQLVNNMTPAQRMGKRQTFKTELVHPEYGTRLFTPNTAYGIANLIANPQLPTNGNGWTVGSDSWTGITGARTLMPDSGSQWGWRVTGTRGAGASGLWASYTRQPVTPGLPYSARAAMYCTDGPASPGTLYIQLWWWDASNTFLSAVDGVKLTSTDGTRQLVVIENAVAPANAASCSIQPRVTAPVAADFVDFTTTEAMLVQGVRVPAYIDGNVKGYGWAGTPDNSQSVGPVPQAMVAYGHARRSYDIAEAYADGGCQTQDWDLGYALTQTGLFTESVIA